MPLQPSELLEFLSRFLPLSDGWSDQWKKFDEHIKSFDENIIFSSAYPDKNKFRINLDFLLKRLFFYCRFPWIGNKCLIVRVGFARPPALQGRMPALAHVPVLYSSNKQTILHNPSGSALEVSKSDIARLLPAIKETKGDPDAIISLASIFDPSLPAQTILLDFPASTPPDNIFLKPALAAAEQIMIYPGGYISRIAVRYLESHRKTFPVWIDPDIEQKFPINLPRKNDRPSPDWKTAGYIPFQFLCKCFFHSPFIWQQGRQMRYQQQERELTNDIVMNNSDSDLKNILSTTREKIRYTLTQIDKWLQNYNTREKKIESMVSEFDDLIISVSKLNPIENITLEHNNDWTFAENFLLELVLSGNKGELAKFSSQIAQKGYSYPGLLVSAQAVLESGFPDLSIVNMDNHLAMILSIILRDKMGISDKDAGIRFGLKLLESDPSAADKIPEIGFVAGVAKFLNGDVDIGAKHLRKSFKNGCSAAGKWLYDLARQQKDDRALKFLAKNLYPDACFDLATKNGNIPFYGRNLFLLYVAASQNHLGALHILAQVEKGKSFNKNLSDDERRIHRLHAIGIYHLLDNNGEPLSSQELYFAGSMLNYERNYQCAIKFLERSAEPGAYCILGRMHHYGNGVSIDFAKAKTFYHKAIAGNDPKARELLEKLEAMEKKQRQRTASSRSSYRREEEYVSSSSTDSGSFCFLTTAVCRYRGLPDDCHVLTTYRRFRDQELLVTDEGKSLVHEYYRIAPSIVEQLEKRQDRDEIYTDMWNNFLEPGYRLVLANKNTAAKSLYIELVQWLVKKLRYD